MLISISMSIMMMIISITSMFPQYQPLKFPANLLWEVFHQTINTHSPPGRANQCVTNEKPKAHKRDLNYFRSFLTIVT